MQIRYLFFILALLGSMGLSWPFSWLFSKPNTQQIGTTAWIDKEIQLIKYSVNNIDEKVLRLSLTAYANAKKKGITDTKSLLTVIDYSKPSTEKRLWVFDLKNNKTLFNTWVSHGKNSGGVSAYSFSNSAGSLKSSIGVFVTAMPYIGGNGYSLRLRGLERGVNDNAFNRFIVFHGAWYVNPVNIKRLGQIGRSWGCPAVSLDTAKSLIDTIKNNTLVFAYYPDQRWLNRSSFLTRL